MSTNEKLNICSFQFSSELCSKKTFRRKAADVFGDSFSLHPSWWQLASPVGRAPSSAGRPRRQAAWPDPERSLGVTGRFLGVFKERTLTTLWLCGSQWLGESLGGEAALQCGQTGAAAQGHPPVSALLSFYGSCEGLSFGGGGLERGEKWARGSTLFRCQ